MYFKGENIGKEWIKDLKTLFTRETNKFVICYFLHCQGKGHVWED